MNLIKRSDFIKNAASIGLGFLIIPKLLQGKSFFKSSTSSIGKSLPVDFVLEKNEYAIVDLHCHPSLKMHLLGKKIWKRHLFRKPGSNLIHMQEDVKEFASGNVKGIIAAHYLVEGGIKKGWNKVRILWPAIKHLFRSFADKIEHEDESNFTQINIMIDLLESQIHIANEKQKQVKFVVARDFNEFELALNSADTIPVAHAIEGAHALGRNFPISPKKMTSERMGKMKMELNNDLTDATLYIRNLLALKARGVCLITLGHFFKNDLASPVEGISPDGKKLTGMRWCYNPDKDDEHLSVVGRKVVAEMLRIGMVVDITHTTSNARKDVFEINAGRLKPRPLVFTHVGAQEIFKKYNKNKFPDYNYYNVSDYDIKQICKCNGVIGVIPEDFWLAGGDTHLRKYGLHPKDFRYGIPYIIETIKYINLKSDKQDYSNVAIGTDFDGLADNPKDLYLNSQLSDLFTAMQKDGGFTPEQIKKIASGNALRLLREGWTEPDTET